MSGYSFRLFCIWTDFENTIRKMDTLHCARMNLNGIEEHERFDDKLEDNHCDRNDFNGNDNLRALDWE